MYGQPEPCVLIAGNGVAASALACVLRERGFGVVLLTRRRLGGAVHGVVEALPDATVRLFAEVGLATGLAAAGAVAVRGFDNAYGPDPAHRLEGMWTHVDRARLARECLLAARRRGATELPVADVGMPVAIGESGVQVRVRGAHGARGGCLRGFAAVDATGRAARWSRPVSRAGAGGAALFSGPGSALPRRGCVTRIEDGWAYRLDHPQASTVGIVTRPGVPATLRGHVAARLDIADPRSYVRVATRPAGVQWCDQPVAPERLPIGDAALAFSPVAGQGLRFALASVLAAATVLESWNDGTGALACDYYRSFVEGARTRHLAKLATIGVVDPLGDPTPRGPRTGMPDRNSPLRFAAGLERVGVNIDGRIVADTCCVLPDGGLVRWVGGFDLLQLRDAVAGGRTWTQVCAALGAAGVPDTTADALMAWALRSGVIAA
ncbi:MAG: NAD(P)/FAD-dependent oxidoreductase [Pseudonocardiaceae bacterium]